MLTAFEDQAETASSARCSQRSVLNFMRSQMSIGGSTCFGPF